MARGSKLSGQTYICFIKLMFLRFKNTLSEVTANFSSQFLLLLNTQGNNKNLVLSPVSIATLLAMLLDGSAHNTHTQINEAIFDGFTEDQINGFVKDFTESVKQTNKGVTFTTNNNIYFSKQANLENDFKKKLSENFNAPFEQKDFQTAAEKARKEINKWISDQTNSRITELFKSGIIASATSMVLVNVNYFQGAWTYSFDSKNTSKSKFHVSKKTSVDVEMMKQENTNFLYYESKDAKILGLPYGNDRWRMYIVLPIERFGLSKLELKLTGERLLTLLRKAANRGYVTTLTPPKFKLDDSHDLGEVLKALGMTDMFDEKAADFSRIDKKKPQYVSNAVHAAFIEVNEEGTKAGSASGATTEARNLPQLIDFKVDEPFLFFIVDTETESIVYFGRVNSF